MPKRHEILRTLNDYRDTWCSPRAPYANRNESEELPVLTTFLDFTQSNPGCFDRSNASGHYTGSALVVDQSLTRVLLTHHRKLNKWLQLGGHADGVHVLHDVAMTEAHEESGLTSLHLISYAADIFGPLTAQQGPLPIDIDCHVIPANSKDPSHHHFDVRYLIVADPLMDPIVSDESHDVRWMSFDEARSLTSERSMLRQFAKVEWIRSKLLL